MKFWRNFPKFIRSIGATWTVAPFILRTPTSVDGWRLIGKGGERLTCFSPLFPEGCVKLSARFCCPQTVREVDYLNYLRKKGVTASFMPKFLGSLSSPSYVGLAVEAFLPTEDRKIWLLGDYLRERIGVEAPRRRPARDEARNA